MKLTTTAYYNEIDPYAAQWLRNLIAAGHIAPGDVDERSIEDVHPDDLKHYTQCHFFAGIGVWSLALRRAGWPDDRPVWTGSCPCQPFSSAGEGAGLDDPRHLWPHFAWLIRQRRPGEVLGEQVASKDAEPWLDLVQADLEAMEYAFGAIAFPSAGIGAPHIRDRTYWVANAMRPRLFPGSLSGIYRGEESPGSRDGEPERPGAIGGMAKSNSLRLEQEALAGIHNTEHHAEPCGGAERMANTIMPERSDGQSGIGFVDDPQGRLEGAATSAGLRSDCSPGPVNGLWADADWLLCRDGKWRPVEPGAFPLAHGAPSRVGRLRAYGNAINAEAATQFIAAYMEAA
ncbi:DNA cytosine methyltransferase [Pseudomonas aeruginosa]|uniref:DNA cytosine methyltransferase n=2 Tax=Pseudomonas aeruginosa TaxID=287 RepID=UPI0003B9EDE7|nr:DNA cytosine methyltransferase [Pseudomonas aeruginosa]HBU0515107.1 DNA cytosine methyltransferase [Klebsiella pneumoniae]ARG87538.1 DNA cytosine methyltransferase [Pseudomonas aeruginosa]ARG87796.1 DNA cytosine methyltransferase [Pseudomonas aeruginosa]AXC23645.1 DNA cytosine methyltransferase [Pseudomonas aeruginosa]AYZ56225.1 DNA cytosine methyltransferase [Pseudomonas aeruginosa]